MKIKIITLLLSAFLAVSFNASAQESTDVLLKNAQEIAKKEGKSIFIKFEASWCGWCHRMTKNIKSEQTKKFFDDNYVIVPIVVKESKGKEHLENPGSTDLLKKFKGNKSGLPFWVILDSNLKEITNSLDDKGQNLGCPANEKEVKEFIKKLKKSSKYFTAKDMKNITNQFVIKN